MLLTCIFGRILKCAMIAGIIAALDAQAISRAHPPRSGSLPNGSRVQLALPPARLCRD